jgi:hypothetical protein
MNRFENVNLLKMQTFGVEIEMSGLAPRRIIEVVAARFGTTETVKTTAYDHDGVTLVGYECTGYDSNGNANTWRVVHDGSISSTGGGSGELVTPVLHYGDIETLQQIVRDLRVAGAHSNSSLGCGVHIHVGADLNKEGGHTTRSLRNLSNLMASHEELLIKACGVSASRYCRNGYTQRSDASFIETLNRVRPTTIERFAQVWYNSHGYNVPTRAEGNHYNHSRYHMLNLHATFLPYIGRNYNRCTCEFRLFEFHGNAMHAGELKAYIQLCLAMSSYSKLVSRVSPEPVDLFNEKKAMKNWLDNMGLVGDEFKTCRTLLGRRLSGDTAYRNGRPVADSLDDLHLVTD